MGVGGEGEGTTNDGKAGTITGDVAGNGRGDGGGDCGDGMGCFCGDDGISSVSEIEAGDEGRDKDAIGEAEVSDSSASSASSALGIDLDVASGVEVNARGVPKDDKEDVGEGSVAAGKTACGGGGGTIESDTSGSVGNTLKSGNTGNFGMFNFLRGWGIGAVYREGAETKEDVEDGDDIIVGVKLNIVEG